MHLRRCMNRVLLLVVVVLLLLTMTMLSVRVGTLGDYVIMGKIE